MVARLTELGRNRYGAAFRSHSGRWEPVNRVGLAVLHDGPLEKAPRGSLVTLGTQQEAPLLVMRPGPTIRLSAPAVHPLDIALGRARIGAQDVAVPRRGAIVGCASVLFPGCIKQPSPPASYLLIFLTATEPPLRPVTSTLLGKPLRALL